MSPKKANKRTSILKKRKSSVESPESTVTSTKKKGILFSEKKTVKEFFQCDDKATIWGTSYEASIAKSEGSSDSSQTSRKISFDFSSSSIHTSNFFASSSATEIIESEKENFVVPHFEEPEEVEGRRTSSLNISTPNSSNNSSSLGNLTVAVSEEEKRRIKKYGTDNLNISNMQLENNLSTTDEKLILSPRKTLYFHENSKFSVSLQEKVLQKPSEVEKDTILMNISENISAMVEEDEAVRVKASRKTIFKNDDMNLTLQNDSKPQKINSIQSTLKPSVFKLPKPPTNTVISKTLQILATEDDTQFSSPPIKPPKLQDPRYTSEDFLDFMVSDTPTKNLCNNMCLPKKHKITPLQSPPPMKFSRPPLDHRELQIMSQLGTAENANNSMDMLKTMGLELTTAPSQKKKTFDMSFDTSTTSAEAQKRKSIFTSENVDETLIKPQTGNRQTLFENSIFVEEPTEIPQVVSYQSRKTTYDDAMDVSVAASPAPQPQKSFFDLDDGTIVDSKTMTLVNIKSLAQPEQPRQSMAIEDASVRYDYAGTPKGSCSVLMNISNATDISETTTELQAKANRLLQNPMATTASTSNLFSKSFQQDMDETGVSQKATPLHTTLPGGNRQRQTIYNTNMSLNMSSAVETNHSTVSKPNLSKKSSLVLGSMISMEDVNISGIEPTQEILIKSRKTLYDGSMEEESFKIQGVVKKESFKPRETIMGSHPMDTSTTEMAAPVRRASSRMTTYRSESIDETMPRDVASPVETKGRITIYEDASIMEESIGQVEKPPVPVIANPRQTTFDVSMDEEKVIDPLKNISPRSQFYLKNRDKSSEELTQLRKTLFSDETKTKKLRQTIYETAMDEEQRQTTFSQDIDSNSVEHTEKARQTVFESSMDEENTFNSSCPSKTGQRLHKMDIEVQDHHKRSSKARQTVYEAEMLEDECQLVKTEQVSKSRQTIYDVAIEESTVTEWEVPIARDAAVNESMPVGSVPGKQFMEAAKQVDTSRFSLTGNDSEQCSLSATVPPPPGFQTPTLTRPLSINFEATKINHSESPAEIFKHPSLEISSQSASTSMSMIKSPVDNTFVVKPRDESRRLMNITDAEFSLLDDESDPCLQESEMEQRPARASISSNTSYHEALQEFVNITLKNSSTFSPNITGSASELPKAQNLDFSTSVDYCQKLEDHIRNRKTMSIKQQPKMEIDKFLENLNIRPLLIPRLPQLQPGFLERKLAESSERHKRKLADQRAKWNAQLPAIPSGAFLMKNYIECLDDEIRRKNESDMLKITLVFPESRDFQFLLKNKFETDPVLSEFWKLDLNFAHMNQYKLCHKQFGAFKINFSVQSPTGNLNDFSIPVYFENVLLYVSPNSRGSITLRKHLLMVTFKREIRTDNLTAMCPSMIELYSFLDMFHACVSKTVQLVDNFFLVILKHSAIIQRHENGRMSVVKRYFNRQTREIVDISVAIGENIEDISIKDVGVKGLSRYTYQLEPRPVVKNMSGLMLIEVILFDAAKFIQENTRRSSAAIN